MGTNPLVKLVKERELRKEKYRKEISKAKTYKDSDIFHLDYSLPLRKYKAKEGLYSIVKYYEYDNSVSIRLNRQLYRLDYEDWFCWFRYYPWTTNDIGVPVTVRRTFFYHLFKVRNIKFSSYPSKPNTYDLRKYKSINKRNLRVPLGCWCKKDGSYDVWLITPDVKFFICNTTDSLITAAAFYNRESLLYKSKFHLGWHNII